MILLDNLRKFVAGHGHGHPAAHDAALALVHLLAPMAPHVADELHERLGGSHCLYRGTWPESDPSLAAEDTVTVVVQVNGKLREKLDMPAAASAADMEAAARECPKVSADLDGKTIRKVVVVPGKLVNFVAN
jgi:leucyl-tRNA synthetase